MVKKSKSGRQLNPTDAFRKEQRKKEISRNKLERKFQRDAHSKKDNPDVLRSELEEIIAAEEDGPLRKDLRLRKKVLQDAFDQSIKKQKVRDARFCRLQGAPFVQPASRGDLQHAMHGTAELSTPA